MIIVDDREQTQHPEIDQLLKVEHKIERLEAADYAFLDRDGNPVGVERSEIGNLVQKIMSGELESQMYKCQDAYDSVILLTEGVYDSFNGLLATYRGSNKGYYRTHVYPRTTYDYIEALKIRLSELGIEVLHSPSFACSITLIQTLYNQRRKPEETHTLFKHLRAVKLPTKLTSNPSVPKLMTLVPRLPEKTAIRLIHRFDSIWNVIHATDEELKEIQGVSTGTIAKLKESLGKDG